MGYTLSFVIFWGDKVQNDVTLIQASCHIWHSCFNCFCDFSAIPSQKHNNHSIRYARTKAVYRKCSEDFLNTVWYWTSTSQPWFWKSSIVLAKRLLKSSAEPEVIIAVFTYFSRYAPLIVQIKWNAKAIQNKTEKMKHDSAALLSCHRRIRSPFTRPEDVFMISPATPNKSAIIPAVIKSPYRTKYTSIIIIAMIPRTAATSSSSSVDALTISQSIVTVITKSEPQKIIRLPRASSGSLEPHRQSVSTRRVRDSVRHHELPGSCGRLWSSHMPSLRPWQTEQRTG